MKLKGKILVVLLALLLGGPTMVFAQKKFTVVIDAGHGGKDPGAIGKISQEKNINLAIALAVSERIKEAHSDVNVLLTRTKDVYLTVAERPKFANDRHADLFISIHTNSSSNASASGTETFTLGVAKTKDNLEVAMKENSVILLEDDYKKNYQGFDPKSVDSYIMFEFMQDKHMEQSIQLADAVQKEFTNSCKRKNRGVQQAGFWVLKTAAMPSVLVEVGFISNPEEEKYLNSEQGKLQLSEAIYKAFASYKRDFDRKSGVMPTSATPAVANPTVATSSKPETKPAETAPQQKASMVKKDEVASVVAPKQEVKEEKTIVVEHKPVVEKKEEETKVPTQLATTKDAIVYKVQIYVCKGYVSPKDAIFKGLNNVSYYKEAGLYKYTYGETTDEQKVQELKREARRVFPDAFVIKFLNGEKVK